jgi:hypothetical protein
MVDTTIQFTNVWSLLSIQCTDQKDSGDVNTLSRVTSRQFLALCESIIPGFRCASSVHTSPHKLRNGAAKEEVQGRKKGHETRDKRRAPLVLVCRGYKK